MNISQEIAKGESSTLEFKKELPATHEQYLKTVVAFANGKGGRIIFGVEDQTCAIVGIEVGSVARTLDRISNAIVDGIVPQIIPDVYLENVDDKTLIVVDVPACQHTPYYIRRQGPEQGVYLRAGATTRRVENYQRFELVLKGGNMNYDSYVNQSLSPATPEEINALCEAITSYGHTKEPVGVQQLINWGVLKEMDGKLMPTVAFCLLARPFAERFCRIQCAEFKGNNKVHFLDSRELDMPVHEMIAEAEDYVTRRIRTAYRIEGIYREELPEIPHPALREIIVNAILHRNYLEPTYIQIAIYDDRIEFYTPGGLPGHLTKEQLLQGSCSKLRNPLLADIFHRMKIVERWGSGIRRIFDSFREAGLPLPEYKVDESSVTVVVHREYSSETGERLFGRRPGDALEVREPVYEVSPTPPEPLPAARAYRADSGLESILHYISRRRNVTFSQMLNDLDVGRRTLAYRLKELSEKGLIFRTGSTRSAVWNATPPRGY